jgi:hypothetical protein
MHWSVAECAYRITIEANTYTTPETWLAWERCSDQQAIENGLIAALESIALLFASDPEWLICGAQDQSVDPSDRVIPFPNKRPEPLD